MSKRDLTQEERKTALLDKIAKKVAVKASVPLKKEAEIFARLFYGNVSLEDLTETPLDALEYAAFEMWEFGFEHKPGQSKIKCFVEKREVKRTKISKTVIELINDNMPFLVDSVAGLLTV